MHRKEVPAPRKCALRGQGSFQCPSPQSPAGAPAWEAPGPRTSWGPLLSPQPRHGEPPCSVQAKELLSALPSPRCLATVGHSRHYVPAAPEFLGQGRRFIITIANGNQACFVGTDPRSAQGVVERPAAEVVD